MSQDLYCLYLQWATNITSVQAMISYDDMTLRHQYIVIEICSENQLPGEAVIGHTNGRSNDNLNLNGLLVTCQIDYTSPGGAP